jgi:hypothetical protein
LDWGSLWVPPSAALCTRYVPFKTHVAPAQFVGTLKCSESSIGLTFQVGGYTTPFAVMGSALFLAAIMTAFVLPEHAEPEEDAQQRCKCLYHWWSDMRQHYSTLTTTLVSLALLCLWIKCAEHTNMRFVFFPQFLFETSLAVIHTRRATPHIHVNLHVKRLLFLLWLLLLFSVSNKIRTFQ